jgi:hypothetical protein
MPLRLHWISTEAALQVIDDWCFDCGTHTVATSDNVMVGACVSRNAVPRHAGNRQAQVYGLPMHPQRPQLNAAEIECM